MSVLLYYYSLPVASTTVALARRAPAGRCHVTQRLRVLPPVYIARIGKLK